MPTIKAYHLKLRSITKSDLELLRIWRNSDAVRLNMLDQDIISTEQQHQWFQSIQNNNDYHFIVEYKEKPIAYANFKTGNNNSGESGLYIGDEKYRGTVIAFCLALAILDFIFINLNISFIDAKVLTHNTAALNFNYKLGYLQIKNSDDIIMMRLNKADYLNAKKEIISLLHL